MFYHKKTNLDCLRSAAEFFLHNAASLINSFFLLLNHFSNFYIQNEFLIGLGVKMLQPNDLWIF